MTFEPNNVIDFAPPEEELPPETYGDRITDWHDTDQQIAKFIQEKVRHYYGKREFSSVGNSILKSQPPIKLNDFSRDSLRLQRLGGPGVFDHAVVFRRGWMWLPKWVEKLHGRYEYVLLTEPWNSGNEFDEYQWDAVRLYVQRKWGVLAFPIPDIHKYSINTYTNEVDCVIAWLPVTTADNSMPFLKILQCLVGHSMTLADFSCFLSSSYFGGLHGRTGNQPLQDHYNIDDYQYLSDISNDFRAVYDGFKHYDDYIKD